MNRRDFLTAGTAGAAGAVVGFTSGGSTALMRDRHYYEQNDAAGPLGHTSGHSKIIWSALTTEKAVALTFDDGPWPEFTPKVLEILDRFGVKATFNVMGYNARHHSPLLLEEVKGGHEIGNHTWSHLDLAFQTPSITLDEIRLGQDAIEDVTGIRTRFFRPPRGELTGSAARYAAQLGHDILLWSIAGDVPGFERPEEVYDHVSKFLAPGGIIGFHDGIGRETFHLSTSGADNLRQRRRAEIDALPQVLEMIMNRGYQVMTVTQLLGLEPTIPPAAGPTSGAGSAAVPK